MCKCANGRRLLRSYKTNLPVNSLTNKLVNSLTNKLVNSKRNDLGRYKTRKVC